ncbi:HK97 family phage prohead protease [Aurantimonas sp. 22II-16-19i]|uniref:HK97 family phage prohead protease n=1 Tax=Aurantimonas sp. 22II-16-19i TaxID=1317114 RepID=UPI00111BFA06|nr:HK97 family phage prohead protease [Aurantimonas sp. 22II-16-19i]
MVPEVAETSYAKDMFALIGSGLAVGLSPGFRIPPPAAVPPEQAEMIEEEDPRLGRAIIRTILQAILFELSIVTRPAYDEAGVEERNWQPTPEIVPVRKTFHLNRWRL